MNTEEFTGLDQDMQALNFKVIQSIKTTEDELVKNVLKDYLKRDVKGKDLKFIGKQFDMVRKNVYFLYFKDEVLGAVEYIMQDNKIGLSFEPMS